MRDLLFPVYHPDLINSLDGGREPTVHTEDLVVYHGREGQVIEDLGAVVPHVDGPVLPETLVVEPVNLGYLSALVVTADQRDPVRISDLGGNSIGVGVSKQVGRSVGTT